MCRKKEKRTAIHALRASTTVEAAGVMSVVLLSIMVLMSEAMRLRGETVGGFLLHEQVERERHLPENYGEKKIHRQAEGRGWNSDITVSVFRPENSLRMWSLGEDLS